jgi:hypothetical protein
LVLRGKTLYVVQNRFNQIAVVELSNDLQTGTVTDFLTDTDFDIPTTATFKGNRLYAVNARFGNLNPATATYNVVLVGE